MVRCNPIDNFYFNYKIYALEKFKEMTAIHTHKTKTKLK